MVGIYFKIDDGWLFDVVEVVEGSPYGDAIQHGEHYAFWNSLTPRSKAERRFKQHAYDYYPRGRVVFFPQRKLYRIYFDPCLTKSDIREVVVRFSLGNFAYEIVDDHHYRCSGCNKYYLE